MTWERIRLGDAGEWFGGATPSKSESRFWEPESVPWLSPKDMRAETLGGTIDLVADAAVAETGLRLVPPGSVAIVVRSGILERTIPVALVPFGTTLNQDMKAIAPRPGIEPAWLAWGLRSFERDLLRDARKRGTTVASLEVPRLKAFELPVPPPAEQRRIVEILEGHLSRLDAARGDVASGQRRLHSLRQHAFGLALNAAGRRARLDTLLETSIGGVWGGDPGSQDVNVRVLRVTELKAWGRIDPQTAVTRSITAKQLVSRRLRAGDLLLEKSGGGPKTPVGRVGLVEDLPGDSVCANFMQLMRPDRQRVEPRFLHLALNGFHLAGGTARMQTASTNIRNIKASEYLQVEVGVPALAEQRLIVQSAEMLLESCSLLEKAIEQSRRRADAMRRALLAAAFSGRLTGSASDVERAEELIDA